MPSASPTIGDVYELVDVQHLGGVECLNVYFYRIGDIFIDTARGTAQVLAENWIDQILPDILPLQSGDIGHDEIRCRNLYDAADQFNTSIFEVGSGTGFSDSDFDALAFVLNGETAEVRKGAKRIAGLTDASNTRGVVTDSATLTAAAAAATAFARPVQVGTLIPSDVFYPVLVKRIRSGVAGAYEYRLPENQGEGVATTIITALFNILVTSQVSRKQGVGS